MATFYIEALEATTITLSKVGSPTVGTAKYGINDTSVPNSYTYGTDISLSAGQKCYWTITKTTTAFSTSHYLNFTSTGRINVGGNLSDLIGGETAIPRDYCFSRLFYLCNKLVDASNLVMVNNFNSKTHCCHYMFGFCTSLTSALQLPATTLANNCYDSMFSSCSSLTSTPELPATTLANNCYSYMLTNCKSLTTPPELPATTLTDSCYTQMFYNCTSLTSAPELPATTLASNCYSSMFNNCTSLTTPPELPATTLTNSCYWSMFSSCTNIKLSTTQTEDYKIPYRIPSSGTGTVGSNSLNNMFTSTGGTFVGTPTINTTYYLYQKPPVTATFYIEALENMTIALSWDTDAGSDIDVRYGINDVSVQDDYISDDEISLTAGQKCYWFANFNEAEYEPYATFRGEGKFNVGGNLSDLIGGSTTIPFDYAFCDLFGYSEVVDASELVIIDDFNGTEGCYCYMFDECTSLTTPPELPATTLSDYCYGGMFYGCTSLTTAPELPATTLTDLCYDYMFYGCTSLITPPQLPATTLTYCCYESMFEGCTSIKLSETQTEDYQIPYRIPFSGTGAESEDSLYNMFYGTGGTFTGTPTINTTYYLYQQSATFYIEAIENMTIALTWDLYVAPDIDVKYGINDTSVPNDYISDDEISLTAGQKCYWFANFNEAEDAPAAMFRGEGKFNVGGNLSDLIGGETTIPFDYAFCDLFMDSEVVDASELVIIDDFNETEGCYCYMFEECASLTTPPQLPATTLSDYCYGGMFYDCISLTIAPELPATTLTDFCYYYMFQGCTSLVSPPQLPATTLTDWCYEGMFEDCTSIKLSETQTGNYQVPYRIPSSGTGTESEGSLDDMFDGTGGTFTGTPTINTTYYMPYPVSITYNENFIAGMKSGVKTLNCANKIMSGNITVTADKPVDITYNETKIVSSATGTKTLNCSNKYMNGNVVVTVK